MAGEIELLIKMLGFAIVLLTFIGSGFLFLRGSAYKGAIEALSATVDSLEKRADSQAEEITDLIRKRNEDKLEIDKLQTENKILLSQRPSNVILESIINMVNNNHQELVLLINGLLRKDEVL